MSVTLIGIFGCASVGCYALTTEKMTLVPPQLSVGKVKRLEETLKVKAVKTTVGGSVLIGALASANSNGVVLPHFAQDEEIEKIKSAFPEINIALMETKRTAYGNIVLANDNGAIVDPRLNDQDIAGVAETLGVEAVRSEIAGLPYVGSLAVATNKGVLAHPMLREEERKLLEEVLKVHVDVGTINNGCPFVASGVLANDHGVVIGNLTTGTEALIISNVLE